jgi:hypothetical protein
LASIKKRIDRIHRRVNETQEELETLKRDPEATPQEISKVEAKLQRLQAKSASHHRVALKLQRGYRARALFGAKIGRKYGNPKYGCRIMTLDAKTRYLCLRTASTPRLGPQRCSKIVVNKLKQFVCRKYAVPAPTRKPSPKPSKPKRTSLPLQHPATSSKAASHRATKHTARKLKKKLKKLRRQVKKMQHKLKKQKIKAKVSKKAKTLQDLHRGRLHSSLRRGRSKVTHLSKKLAHANLKAKVEQAKLRAHIKKIQKSTLPAHVKQAKLAKLRNKAKRKSVKAKVHEAALRAKIHKAKLKAKAHPRTKKPTKRSRRSTKSTPHTHPSSSGHKQPKLRKPKPTSSASKKKLPKQLKASDKLKSRTDEHRKREPEHVSEESPADHAKDLRM